MEELKFLTFWPDVFEGIHVLIFFIFLSAEHLLISIVFEIS